MTRAARLTLGALLVVAGIAGYALRRHVTGAPPTENWWRPVWTVASWALVAGGAYVVATGLTGRQPDKTASDVDEPGMR